MEQSILHQETTKLLQTEIAVFVHKLGQPHTKFRWQRKGRDTSMRCAMMKLKQQKNYFTCVNHACFGCTDGGILSLTVDSFSLTINFFPSP